MSSPDTDIEAPLIGKKNTIEQPYAYRTWLWWVSIWLLIAGNTIMDIAQCQKLFGSNAHLATVTFELGMNLTGAATFGLIASEFIGVWKSVYLGLVCSLAIIHVVTYVVKVL
jgi:hypothetical protein